MSILLDLNKYGVSKFGYAKEVLVPRGFWVEVSHFMGYTPSHYQDLKYLRDKPYTCGNQEGNIAVLSVNSITRG